jgi:MYXO-CTERM domain-containing protein
VAAGLFAADGASAQIADLSTWAGNDNTSPPNSYTVTSQTSAGGTFQTRFPGGAYLADTSLNGVQDSTLPFDAGVSVSGTLTFAEGAEIDPDFWIGFFNRGPDGEPSRAEPQLVISPADNGADGSFRWIIRTDNGDQAPLTNFLIGSPIANGTYPFTLSYSGGTVSASVGGSSTSGTTTEVAGATFDSFGFAQPPANAAGSFSLSIENITYTGQTDVPEPAGLALLGVAGLFALRRRR